MKTKHRLAPVFSAMSAVVSTALAVVVNFATDADSTWVTWLLVGVLTAAGGAIGLVIDRQRRDRPIAQTTSRAPLRATLASAASASISDQLEKLTDCGTLVVPWITIGGRGTPTRQGTKSGKSSRVPTLLTQFRSNGNRMVIGGDSNSGKTTILHQIAKEIDYHKNGSFFPVILPLASWQPSRTSFYFWIAQQLSQSFPASISGYNLDELVELLKSGRVALLLDGFDEIKARDQPRAAQVLRSIHERVPIIVTARTESVDMTDSKPTQPSLKIFEKCLTVVLRPVPSDEVRRYLSSQVVSTGFFEQISQTPLDDPLMKTLSSPLMAWLSKTIYSSPGNELPRDLPDTVADKANLPKRKEDIESFLLRSLVPAVFFRQNSIGVLSGRKSSRFDETQAVHWLEFLASTTRKKGDDISFWKLSRSAPMFSFGALATLLCGILLGTAYHALPLAVIAVCFGFSLGLIFGFGFGRGYSMSQSGWFRDTERFGFGGRKPGDDLDLRAHAGKFGYGMISAIVLISSTAITVHLLQGAPLVLPDELDIPGITVIALAAVAITAVASFVGGGVAAAVLHNWEKLKSGVGSRAQSPADVVTNDRRSGLGMIFLSWMFVSATSCLVILIFVPSATALGLLAGLGAIPSATSIFNVWVNYKVAHIWLVATNRLPWQLTEFLGQAHDNGILRQRGVSYEFRHARLRESLARSYRDGGKSTVPG